MKLNMMRDLIALRKNKPVGEHTNAAGIVLLGAPDESPTATVVAVPAVTDLKVGDVVVYNIHRMIEVDMPTVGGADTDLADLDLFIQHESDILCVVEK